MEQPAGELLKTKLFIPRVRQKNISRPALINWLSAGLESCLILISAPAGSGKTTLLVEWLQHISIPAVWLSLDENDNEINRFMLYLMSAIQTAWPDFGDIAAMALSSPQPPPSEMILSMLINEMTVRGDLVVVLDDYHVIRNEMIHSAINFLIDHLPPQLHLVIATRSDPPLSLPRLRGRMQLTEIRSAQLRFTHAEVVNFLNQVMDLSLSREVVESLEKRTEGWIVGLQMAGLSMKGANDLDGFVRAFTGSNQFILDYLLEEVLQRQPPEIQDFLLRTSILDRLSADLCNALLWDEKLHAPDPYRSHDILTYLEHNNLFLIPLDDEFRWFRYHHLFADLLRNQLERTQGSQVNELHRRASHWFELQGLVPDALSHAIKAGDFERAAELVEKNATQMLMQGYVMTIGDWLSMLPKNLVRAHPWLCVDKSWFLVISGESNQIEPYLEEAQRHLPSDPQESQNILGNIAAIRAFIATKKLDAPLAVQMAHKALAEISENDASLRCTVYYNLGVSSLMIDDLPGACQALKESGRLAVISNNLNMAVPSISSLAVQEIALGRLHQAESTLQEALRLTILPDGRRLPLSMRALSELSELHYEWNHLDLARHYADECFNQGSLWGNTAAMLRAYLALSQVHLSQGEISQAQAAYTKAEEIIRLYHIPDWSDAYAMRYRVRLWLQPVGGNLAAARSWAEERIAILNSGAKLHYLREVENIAVSRVYITLQCWDIALALLERLYTSASDGGRVSALIQILVLMAAAQNGLGETQKALQTFEKALDLAEPEEYVRSIVDEGSLSTSLLIETVRQRQTAHLGYASRLLSAIGYELDANSQNVYLSKSSSCSQIPAGLATTRRVLVEPLTARELEVLQRMAQGLTNTQMASQLFVAVSTIKRHVNHIFSKLDVTSRSKAIVAARELGLI
jgi:LuxR family transcriptional regulator, maltose regulon positive regulatory protein